MTTKEQRDIVHPDMLPGPKTFYASGYGSDQVNTLRAFLSQIGYEQVPVQVCTKGHLDLKLEEALTADIADDALPEGALPYVLVISGQEISTVEHLLKRFGQSGLPRPIFATTTENNLSFSVKELLRHLLAERQMASAR